MIGEVATEDVRSAIVEHLRSTAAGQTLDPDAIDDDVNLLAAGIIDSFGVLELIASIEEQFGLRLDFEDIDPVDLTTVGPLTRIVASASAGLAPSEGPPVRVVSTPSDEAAVSSAPTSPTLKARGATGRLPGRSAVSVHRFLQRARGKAFSLFVGGAFESFGKNTVLQPPIRLLGEDRISIGFGVFVGPGAWFQTLPSPEGERGSIRIGTGPASPASAPSVLPARSASGAACRSREACMSQTTHMHTTIRHCRSWSRESPTSLQSRSVTAPGWARTSWCCPGPGSEEEPSSPQTPLSAESCLTTRWPQQLLLAPFGGSARILHDDRVWRTLAGFGDRSCAKRGG